MLRICFGELKEALYGPTWFTYCHDLSWFQDERIQEMVREIDKTEYLGGSVFNSPVLGMIPPEKLSGGVKTLIVIDKMPDKVFDATNCGENCAPMLLEIGRRTDVTVNLRAFLPLKSEDSFEIEIVNTGSIVTNEQDYALAALDCLAEAGMWKRPDLSSAGERGADKKGSVMRPDSPIPGETVTKGKHHVVVESPRLKYEFDIKQNITILRGDSATGKTTLIDMLLDDQVAGGNSPIRIESDVPCVALGGVGDRWERVLELITDSIVFIDDGNPFIRSKTFAKAVQESTNDFVLITRETLPELPYRIQEIYGLRTLGKAHFPEKTHVEFYPIFGDAHLSESGADASGTIFQNEHRK